MQQNTKKILIYKIKKKKLYILYNTYIYIFLLLLFIFLLLFFQYYSH